ncbi:MAG: 1-acyl-sn-glycerol-3-phosphate acyltransferase, partial [Duodenibacillus sp.]
MRQLRAWCFYLWCALTIIPVAVACLLTWPVLPRRVRYERIALPWARMLLRTLALLCGVRYRVLGEENIPRDGRALVVLSKHQSAWETIFLP